MLWTPTFKEIEIRKCLEILLSTSIKYRKGQTFNIKKSYGQKDER